MIEEITFEPIEADPWITSNGFKATVDGHTVTFVADQGGSYAEYVVQAILTLVED